MLKTMLFVMAVTAGTMVLTNKHVVAADSPLSRKEKMDQGQILQGLKTQELELKQKLDSKQNELSQLHAGQTSAWHSGMLNVGTTRADYEKQIAAATKERNTLEAQYNEVQAKRKALEQPSQKKRKWFKGLRRS
jgi:chromosome segregation ATPase